MPSLEQAVKALRSENGDMTVYQWVTEIQNILQQNYTYEKNNLEPVSDGSNVIEDFFGRQKKGYCIHFASAGVMMLRLAGIPADTHRDMLYGHRILRQTHPLEVIRPM